MKHLIVMLVSLLMATLVAAAEPVDINQASAEQLADNLLGVGQSKAEAIVRYREENGPFQHPDELVNVRGIGISTVDKNRDMILVNGSRVDSAD